MTSHRNTRKILVETSNTILCEYSKGLNIFENNKKPM